MSVIEVRGVSKEYRIGAIAKDSIIDSFRNILSKSKEENSFLALNDISFAVDEGDVLGIVGRNGAGKSTLLKILSRITEPSSGTIKMKGRVSSLLEVGTGFHPELTGRENIFLNGAILGMSKKEIKSKFEEIVDFSGVRKFVDTPVKHYSSGMYVRLAFSVAAHLEPEILIIDEVLAVGDAEFQKKCLGKMKDVAGEGRTVLFVSHNLAAVKTLCTRAILLEKGELIYSGNVPETVSRYMNGIQRSSLVTNIENSIAVPGIFNLRNIEINNENKSANDIIVDDAVIVLNLELDIETSNPQRYVVTFHLSNEEGDVLFSFSSNLITKQLKQGKNNLCCYFPKQFFQSGEFYLSFFFVEDEKSAIFIEKNILRFTVIDGGRKLGSYMGKEPGYIRPSFEWKLVN